MNPPESSQPRFSHAEPVLPVEDVAATIKYWQEVLAFPTEWMWGDPPSIGAVSWHGAHVQFFKNAERAKTCAGSYVWIRLQHIDELYKIHQERNADIVEKLERQDWGMDQYVVKDMNGHYIAFAGHSAVREKSGAFPKDVKLEERMPTEEEVLSIAESVGWSDFFTKGVLKPHLSAPVYCVVAIDTNTGGAIGCAFVLSDNASFYYIKDVMVHPDFQKKKVGTALMRATCKWIDRNGIDKSLVGLYCAENLEPFYRQFGFAPSFAMTKRL